MKAWLVGLFLMFSCVPAFSAGRLAQVEIVDPSTGRGLPMYLSGGRYYVAGAPGREYVIRLRNRSRGDLLAVVSVDGVNVVSGETAAVEQGGYILGSRQRFDIKGWRKSLDQVASFYFSSVDASYAARTGRPDNIGVIGVAVFKRRHEPILREDFSGADESAMPRSQESSRSRESAKELADSESLGTGHGRRKHSQVRYGEFERASQTPIEVTTVYYDSRANLIARGVIPGHGSDPEPFPNGFVADPPSG